MEITLRPYQSESIEHLREGIRSGHRCQVLNSPTGSGKGVLLAYLMQEAHRKQKYADVIVDRVSLVDQISATLDFYGIPHGVTQASHWRNRPHERIQVCSAQTLESRGFTRSGVDLIIHDEAHVSRSLLRHYFQNAKANVIGLTATALTKGLADVYSRVVNVTTTNALLDDGWLSPLKIYAAKAPDMKGARIVAGEFHEQDAEERGLKIVGDVVQEWHSKTRLHFGSGVKTICFSSTVAHGEEICRQFQAIGQNFVQISYLDGSDEKRRAIIEEFRKPDSNIVGLVSVDALVRGFDVPDIKCVIIARPFRKSLSSHIQLLGRGMRVAPGKEFCLVLDHANNVLRFKEETDEIFANGIHELDDTRWEAKARPEPDEKVKKDMTCSVCHYLLMPGMMCCPACGKERVRRSLVENMPGQLVPVEDKRKPEPPMPTWQGNPSRTWNQLCGMAMQRKKGDVQLARKWALGQYKGLFDKWPTEPFNPAASPHVDIDLNARIVSNTIRWAKSRAQRMKDEVRAMNLGKE